MIHCIMVKTKNKLFLDFTLTIQIAANFLLLSIQQKQTPRCTATIKDHVSDVVLPPKACFRRDTHPPVAGTESRLCASLPSTCGRVRRKSERGAEGAFQQPIREERQRNAIKPSCASPLLQYAARIPAEIHLPPASADSPPSSRTAALVRTSLALFFLYLWDCFGLQPGGNHASHPQHDDDRRVSGTGEFAFQPGHKNGCHRRQRSWQNR